MRLHLMVVTALIILWASKGTAQNYELGKVTIAELQEKSNAKDTAAPAAILFKKGRTFFTYTEGKGLVVNNVYEFRIKIYKKEGLKWANQKVSYYVGYENLNDDTVNFSNAATYNLENGEIVKTKLNSEGSFKNKINKYWNEATITLPNVKVGSIIEFKYILKSENIVRLPDFDFQYNIPVNYFEYKTEIPEFFIYKSLVVGNLKVETNAELVLSSQIFVNGYKQINSFYTSKDIPALNEERFIDNINNYKGAIQNELEKERYPDKPVVNYTKTWEGVATSIYKSKDFGDELKQKDYFSVDLKNILQKTDSKKERLNLIFQFVQNRMNWNGKRSYFVDKGVKKAYEERSGNVAEINFILISMLKAAGIEASPVLASTVENGIPVFPNRTVFNYVIGAAEIDGQKILLDAANKFTTPNILPLSLLNWKGRLIKEDGSSQEVDLIPKVASKENYTITASIKPEVGEIDGKLRIKKTDYEALRFREVNSNNNESSYLEKLENDLGKIEIEDYKIENKTGDLSKSVQEEFNFKARNSYDFIGGKIFLRPILFFTDVTNPFKQEKRQMPVYFGYPNQKTYNLFLDIPDGFVVESLPKPMRIVTENRDASYTMNMIAEENKIHVQVTKEINKYVFATDDYNMLKEFFQNIIASQNEKIVLKRI
ncbi:protein of unknown function [Flavobacterium aquidurense]|uniref:DUF3857 domain-containing protein n=1 Tax=Flavobacterium frigidimaris TaxID=262320 RepID=A0ABX4BWN8_FLAFR|nr:DUF3857 domain-containing protein [Flavobacterium frigidimaris]OXA82449.1 hypothetical protein B0A65_00155 [Flavobacterium frigidimaris]SDZ48596.1 protein of unknown function [Flavobacterium aquidurense]